MGFVFTVFASIAVAALLIVGWHSLDLICACAPLSHNAARGVIGLFFVAGSVLGAVLSFMWA